MLVQNTKKNMRIIQSFFAIICTVVTPVQTLPIGNIACTSAVALVMCGRTTQCC